jgi:hypothetical protein
VLDDQDPIPTLALRPAGFADMHGGPLLWLSPWLSQGRIVAGMDGNRTHPGRLSSAPQTVLKTAGGTSPQSSPAAESYSVSMEEQARKPRPIIPSGRILFGQRDADTFDP